MQLFKKFLVTIVLYLFVSLTFYLAGDLFYKSIIKLDISDFHVYYYVPKMVMSDNLPTHPYISYSPIYPYFFPPASIPLLFLLSLVPFYLSKIIWTIINFILLGYSIYLILKTFDLFSKVTFTILTFLAVVFYPIGFTIRDGQFNIVLLFIFSFALYFFKTQQYMKTSALLVVIGIVSKISPGILLFYGLLRRKFIYIFYSLIFVGVFMLLAEIFVAPKINLQYFRDVVSTVSDQSSGNTWREQSLLDVLKKLNADYKLNFSKNTLSAVIYTIVILLIGIFVYFDYKKHKSIIDSSISIALLCFISVTGTGLTWFHQYSILFMPIIVMLLISILYLNRYRSYFIGSYIIVFLLWCINLSETFINYKYFRYYMLWGGILFLINTLIIKSNQKLLNDSIKINFQFSYFENKRLFMILSLSFFLIGLNFWNLNELLKESRDRARVSYVSFMGKKLTKFNPRFELGESDSIAKVNRIDRGYILLEKNQFKKIISEMSVLYLDPINQDEYKIKFKGLSTTDFELSVKLESKKYIDEFGTDFMFSYTKK